MNALIDLKYSSKAIPTIPVGHKDYVWHGAADTDVQRTWKRFGWKAVNGSEAGERKVVEDVRPLRKVVRVVRRGAGQAGVDMPTMLGQARQQST